MRFRKPKRYKVEEYVRGRKAPDHALYRTFEQAEAKCREQARRAKGWYRRYWEAAYPHPVPPEVFRPTEYHWIITDTATGRRWVYEIVKGQG